MGQQAVSVIRKTVYKNYGEFLYHEVPAFVERVARLLGLRYRYETEFDEGGGEHFFWIEGKVSASRWTRFGWGKVAKILKMPGFKDGLGTHESLQIEVWESQYLAALQEMAHRFEWHFGLRAEMVLQREKRRSRS